MKRRLVATLLALLCVIGVLGISTETVSADANEEIQITGQVEDQDTLVTDLTNAVEQYWNAYAWTDIVEQYKDQFEEEQLNKFQSWAELQSTLGEYDKILSMDLSQVEEGTAKVVANYEAGKVQFVCSIEDGIVSDVTEVAMYEEETGSFGARMSKAGINTVMSICIVFVVLIFIACIISLFKFIPKIEAALTGKKEEKTTEVVVAEPATPVVEEDVTDDTELVAVITAAIMASLGDEAPADGLHISSIKRRTQSKWKRS